MSECFGKLRDAGLTCIPLYSILEIHGGLMLETAKSKEQVNTKKKGPHTRIRSNGLTVLRDKFAELGE